MRQITLILLILLLAAPAFGQLGTSSFIVDSAGASEAGVDYYGNPAQLSTHATIQAAMLSADADGDTIFVRNGDYYEDGYVGSSDWVAPNIKIIGQSQAGVVFGPNSEQAVWIYPDTTCTGTEFRNMTIDGNGNVTSRVVNFDDANDNHLFTDVTFTGAGTFIMSNDMDAAPDGTLFTRCTFNRTANAAVAGVYLYSPVTDFRFVDCTFTTADGVTGANEIMLQGTAGVIFEGCTIVQGTVSTKIINVDGNYSTNTPNTATVIKNCDITAKAQCNKAINFGGSGHTDPEDHSANNCVVAFNTLHGVTSWTGAGYGIEFERTDSINDGYHDNNCVIGNRVFNFKYGIISAEKTAYSVFSNNLIESRIAAAGGMAMQDSRYVTFSNNTIRVPGYGIKVMKGGLTNEKTYACSFTGNWIENAGPGIWTEDAGGDSLCVFGGNIFYNVPADSIGMVETTPKTLAQWQAYQPPFVDGEDGPYAGCGSYVFGGEEAAALRKAKATPLDPPRVIGESIRH